MTDELRRDLIQIIDDAMKDKYPQLDIQEIKALLSEIEDLLPDEKYRGLRNRIEQFIMYKYDGTQKVQGALIDIPAIISDYKQDFVFDKDIFLTGLHFNQTGWKKNDRYTKEIGEHKYFNTYYKVNANTPVSFILHNNSGNSRQTLVDLEYLEGQETTINPSPPDPDINDIPNDWDIAVRMQWEESSPCDMDLHGFMGDMHVAFWNRTYDGFYLNWDYQEHISNDNPEIISVRGHYNRVLRIYIHDYNLVPLKKPVNIKIYEKRSYGVVLLKEYDIEVENKSPLGYGVCSIDLKTKKITDIFTRKNIFE